MGKELSLAERHGEAGQTVSVAVSLDDASSVAALELLVNYDGALVELAGVTNPPGSLGQAFLLDCYHDDRQAVVRMYRDEGDALVSGSGLLVHLSFVINPGAEAGMFSDLTVASRSLVNGLGARLSQSSVVQHRDGRVWVTLSDRIDSDDDGLSDYEEQMLNGIADLNTSGGDTDPNNPDTDGDGMKDGYEVANNLNPFVHDATEDPDRDGLSNALEHRLGLNAQESDTDNDGFGDYGEYVAATDGLNPGDFFSMRAGMDSERLILRWRSATGRVYKVFFATNLLDGWAEDLGSSISGDGSWQSHTNREEGNGYFGRVQVELEDQ